MGALSILLLIVFGITAILLVIVVLLQDEGGEGLGGIFGGGGAGPVGNRSGNILTKTTTVLGAIFLVTAFALAWLNRSPDTGNVEAAARQLESGEEQALEWWQVEESDDDGGPALDDLEGGEGNVQGAPDDDTTE
jgi:preprotein translocase subunit SecG